MTAKTVNPTFIANPQNIGVRKPIGEQVVIFNIDSRFASLKDGMLELRLTSAEAAATARLLLDGARLIDAGEEV